jgi:hypothetical protein
MKCRGWCGAKRHSYRGGPTNAIAPGSPRLSRIWSGRMMWSGARIFAAGNGLRCPACSRWRLFRVLCGIEVGMTGRRVALSGDICQRWRQPQVPPLRFPRFPVEVGGVGELHAAFLNESRTRGRWWVPGGRKSGFAPVGMTNRRVALPLNSIAGLRERRSTANFGRGETLVETWGTLRALCQVIGSTAKL